MPIRPFEARIRQQPRAAIIDLHGEIDGGASERLHAAFDAVRDTEPAAVLLNFTDVDYINSAGIALIVGLLARAREAGVDLLVCGLSDHYREIFTIIRLVDYLTIYPDERSALQALVR